ncbi:hypothetical protein A2U01_0025269, partial [Trifolium medium]|nr:hypothetical protein [Trifolium medium]
SGSGNRLNMYLNLRVYGSILTEGKNFTREGGEDREVAVRWQCRDRLRWSSALLQLLVS